LTISSVAIIASFRQHYEEALRALQVFHDNGIEVTSPKGTPIVEPGIAFVRFRSDCAQATDGTVQSIAMHRILRANAVYVVAPDGYVGRTTCYEIGRVIQAARPVYFSERPTDLPICVPEDHIATPQELAEVLIRPDGRLTSLHTDGHSRCCQLERRLLDGDYIHE